jgi:hypothetical protein
MNFCWMSRFTYEERGRFPEVEIARWKGALRDITTVS